MYHLPDETWRIGGAVRQQSKITSVSNPVYDPRLAQTPVRQGGFGLLDLAAGYRVNETFDIQLNVKVVDSFSGGNFVGEPRNVQLTGK